MLRAAEITDNVVTNFILVENFTENWIDPQDSNIGDIWDGTKFIKPVIELTRDEKKIERSEHVSRITVTVDGMTFDGDEESQNRMARAVIALNAAGVEKTTWVLSNNIPTEVTATQLAAALIAAGKAQTSVWVI